MTVLMSHPTHPGPHLFGQYTSLCHIFFFPYVTLTAISLYTYRSHSILFYAIPLFSHTLRAISFSTHLYVTPVFSFRSHLSSQHTHTWGHISPQPYLPSHPTHSATSFYTPLHHIPPHSTHTGSHLFLHTSTPHLSSQKTHTGSHLFRHTLGHISRQPHTQGHTKFYGTLTPRATSHSTPLGHTPT